MTRVELICLNEVRTPLVSLLQDKGLLHLEESMTEIEGAPNFLNRVQLEGAEHEELVRLEAIERTLNEAIPLLTERPVPAAPHRVARELESESNDAIAGEAGSAADELRAVTSRRASLQDQVEVLSNYQAILDQVAPALGGSDIKLGRGTRALVLSGNVKKTVPRLEERLRSEIGPVVEFHKTQTSRKRLVGLLSFPEDRDGDVSRILSQEGVTTVDMRDDAFADKSIGEVRLRIQSTIEEHRAEIAELDAKASAISKRVGAPLLGAKLVILDRLGRLRAQHQFAASKMVTVIQGWTPSDAFPVLERTVQEQFPGQVEINRVSHDEDPHTAVPTLLRNPRFFKPFEVLLKLFRPPTYGTLDPTILIAVSFIIFYGFIVGDFVYGLVILLFALWLRKKWGHNRYVRDAGTIGIYMGVSSMIFGVLFGEYAGEYFAAKYNLPAFWFHRGHEKIDLLLYALYFGVIHVLLALGLGITEHWRHGHKSHAIEKAGSLLGVLALIIIAFGFFGVAPFNSTIMMVIAGVFFLAGATIIIYTLGGMMGAVGVLEIMSLGGNIISYARLMALGVAAIAIADIANGIPEAIGPEVGIPAAILVHLLNIFISMASPTIHALRLQFVEFLPKFYAPEGIDFQPLKKETQS